jgi:hypothetical protein
MIWHENRRIKTCSKHRRIWIGNTKKCRTKHGQRECHTFSEVTCTPPVVGHPPHLHSRAGRRWGSGAGTPVVSPPSALGRTAAAPLSPAGWAPVGRRHVLKGIRMKQCCGTVTIFYGSGSGFCSSYGSGSGSVSKP